MAAWLFLWIWWLIQEAISTAYVVVALISFRNVQRAKPYVTNEDTYDLNAVLSALFLGVVILILFFVVSLVLLLKNAVNREPLSGFGNGILLASSFHTAVFQLLTALVVYSASNLTKVWERNPNLAWNAGQTAAYYATYVIAFMLAGIYLVYAVLILVLRNVFVREEKEAKLAAAPAPVAAAPPTTAQAPAPATTKPTRRGWFSRKPNAAAAAEPQPAAPATPQPASPNPVPQPHTEPPRAAETRGAWDVKGDNAV